MAYPSTVAQIDARMTALANDARFSAFCTRIDLAPPTHEGRTVGYLRIGTATGGGRPRVLIVSGVHAREFAPPDAVMTFVEKLLTAYATTAAVVYDRFDDARLPPTIRYARFRIPFPVVQRIITQAELYVLPLANPDGRAFAQAALANNMWRKNRRPAPPGARVCASPGDDVGVDINRNFDIGWDFGNYYSPAALTAMATPMSGETLGVSDDPCSELYHGPGPAVGRTREPETNNIVNVLNGKDINFYMDVHSAAGHILFPWGLEQNQESFPDQTFKNPVKDRMRDALGATYAEWMPPGTEARHRTLGKAINDAILDSTGFTAANAADDPVTHAPRDPMARRARLASDHTPVQSLFLFGTTQPADFEPGGSDDFAFSRQIDATPGPLVSAFARAPVVSFTFECGRPADGGFHPDASTTYPKVEREVGAGLAAFVANAAGWHSAVVSSASPPPATPAPSSTCFIATAAYGSPLHPKVRYLCDVRDRHIKTTRFGKSFMRAVDRVYYSFSPQAADWLRAHRRACTAVRLFVAEPWIAIVRVSAAATRPIRPAELRAASFLGLVVAGTLAALTAIGLLLFIVGRIVASVV